MFLTCFSVKKDVDGKRFPRHFIILLFLEVLKSTKKTISSRGNDSTSASTGELSQVTKATEI
jgi:hypothetical protein